MPEFEPVIGLEVHAELMTFSKMFCGCAVVDPTSAEPNTSVCEICTGMPGTLPVINQRAVEYALRVALALHCGISETSIFARKNYFYPDLPKGFQISQYEIPLAQSGHLLIDTDQGEKSVRIRRVHLEEDTGKLSHRPSFSLVDYNRSGVPLLEIVSEPDIHSLDEVKTYATSLRSLLRYLQVSSGDMEKGVMRFEANVSVRPADAKILGTRTEIKNLNSFRSMIRAVAYEVERQTQVISEGGQVTQETLGWDESSGTTFSQRGKEEAHDYRYFPEPDLPPLHLDPSWIDEIRSLLPELPHEKTIRFTADYDLTPYTASVLTAERYVADYFEEAVSYAPEIAASKLANWLSSNLFGLLNEAGITLEHCKISAEHFAELVRLVETGDINASSGKAVLERMFASGDQAVSIVEKQALRQITDPELIRNFVQEVLDSHPEQVRQYLEGKHTIQQWFFGQVMRIAGGKADPSLLQPILIQALQDMEESHRMPE
jgi:aspartyl-tRNA(Asn)/glutamyl-tRNA(Gln) amidotransferase subunit B